MLRLRDIMTTNVISIAHDMSIRDAMAVLSSRHISGAPVMEGGRVVGVISNTDLLAFASELPRSPMQTPPVADEADLALLDEQDAIDDAPPATFFMEMWEDVGADAAARIAQSSGPEWDVLDDHNVAEAMTRSPLVSIPSDTPLSAAADFMRQHDVHRLLVMDKDHLVGIVTATDIADAVADHKLREQTIV